MYLLEGPRTVILLCFIVLIVVPSSLFSQSERKADKAFREKEYHKSYTIYQQLLKSESCNIHLNYKYANTAFEINDYSEAEKYFTKVMEDSDNYLYPMSAFWLAQVKKNLGKYEEASELFKAFSMYGIDDYYTNWAAMEIQNCQKVSNLKNWEETIQVDLLDEPINSEYSEIGAIEMGNLLYYSTSNSRYKSGKRKANLRLNKMKVSENLERPKNIPNEFADQGRHFCHTAFSKQWERMYFTVCENVNSELVICEIRFMDRDKRGKWKKESHTLPKHINLPGYTTTQPAIGYDSTIQSEILFFASDRPDGKGKMDIWYSKINEDGFSEPVNLAAINTLEDDITPYFHNGTQTLFFSSKYYPGYGGYDVFSIEKTTDGWGKVENAGMPINSSYDDMYFSKNTSGNRGYFSSNRLGIRFPRGMKEGSSLDIYRLYFKKEQKLLPDTETWKALQSILCYNWLYAF